MPRGPLPTSHLDLLTSRTIAQLATVDSGNRPQVNPVWFLWDDDKLFLSIKPNTVKFRNLQANPAAALSILDSKDSFRYLELRGRVAKFELYTTLEFVNLLAHKYTGADFTGGRDGEERYKVTIQIDSWTAAGH
jgi:PPOX class probable F420-dependent enzyme